MTTSPLGRSSGPRSAIPALALAAVLGLASMACSSTGDDETAAVADIPTEADDDADSEADADDEGDSEGGSSDDGASGEPTEADFEEAQLAFEQCLAEEGIEVDFGGGGGEGIDGDGTRPEAGAAIVADGEDVDFEAAMEKCDGAFDGVAGSFEPTPEQEAELRDAEVAFANCMAEMGFELPTPSSEGGGDFAIELDDTVDIEEMNAALEECSETAFGQGGLFVGGGGLDQDGEG